MPQLKFPRRIRKVTKVARKTGPASTLLDSGEHSELFPKYVAISLALGCANTFALLMFGFLFIRLTNRPPAMVQLADGRTLQAEHQLANHRSNQAIRAFVELELSSLFTWDPLVTSGGIALDADKGVLRGDARLPSSLAAAEYGLSIDGNFREGTIAAISESFKKYQKQVFAGQMAQYLDIVDITEPQPLEKTGEWKVNVIANQVLKVQDSAPEYIPFNRTVYLRAEHRDRLPPAKDIYGKYLNEIRGYGLTVFAMREIDRSDFTSSSRPQEAPNE